MKSASEFILSADEFRMLEGMRLTPRRAGKGRVRGERLTTKKGISIEFADFRDYVDGDDVRHLDWNVLARTQTPVIRTYRDEEDIAVYVFLDCSKSMSFGDPQKAAIAKRIAAAISYIGLCGGDAVHLVAGCKAPSPTRPLRGRSQFLKVDDWISEQSPDGSLSLSSSLQSFVAGRSRAGLLVVISDGLDEAVVERLGQASGRGHEVAFIHVLSAEEIDPDIEGDLRLIDCENASGVEITATRDAIGEYKRNLQRHCKQIEDACVRFGGRFLQVARPFEFDTFVKDSLRRQGWMA